MVVHAGACCALGHAATLPRSADSVKAPSQQQPVSGARHDAALLLVLVLCAASAAVAQPVRPGGHMAHAAARVGGVPVTPIRGDYIGSPMQMYSSAVCANGLTCSPLSCKAGTNTACAVSNNLGTTSNKTNSGLASVLASIASRTCTVSSDARCTTAALTAVFGHYPGILAAYCNDAYLVIHSSGLTAHPTSLGSIYTPPGGGKCLSGAATCGYLDQARSSSVRRESASRLLVPCADASPPPPNARSV